MGFLGGIVSGVAGLAGNILSNKANKKEAQVNRDWQEDMSNTAIVRRMQDLKNAGLNPLLAVSNASSGATTPTGAQATYDYNGFKDSVSNAVQLSMQKEANDANIANTNARTENVRQDTINKKQEEISKRLDNLLKKNDINMTDFRNKILVAQSKQEFNKVLYTELANKKLSEETKNLIQRTAKEEWELELSKENPANTVQGMYETHKSNVHKNPWTSWSVIGNMIGNALFHGYDKSKIRR